MRPLAGFQRFHEGVEEQRGVQLAQGRRGPLRALRRGDLAVVVVRVRHLLVLLVLLVLLLLLLLLLLLRGGRLAALTARGPRRRLLRLGFLLLLGLLLLDREPGLLGDCALLGEGGARPTAAAGLQGRHARHEQHGEVLRDGVDEPVVRLLQRRVRLGGDDGDEELPEHSALGFELRFGLVAQLRPGLWLLLLALGLRLRVLLVVRVLLLVVRVLLVAVLVLVVVVDLLDLREPTRHDALERALDLLLARARPRQTGAEVQHGREAGPEERERPPAMLDERLRALEVGNRRRLEDGSHQLDAPVQRHEERRLGLEREDEAEAVLGVLLRLELEGLAKEAPRSTAQLAEHLESLSAEGSAALLGLEQRPQRQHELRLHLRDARIQEIGVERVDPELERSQTEQLELRAGGLESPEQGMRQPRKVRQDG